MEEDLLTLLRREPQIAEFVGNRISQDIRPQDTDEPAIVVSRIDGAHEHQLTGSAGFAMPTMHVMCFAPSAVTANELRDRTRDVLQGVGGKTVGDTKFMAIIFDDEDHAYIPPIDASDRGTYARLLVIGVMHEESIPAFN
jgi:hypothetical protein